MADFKRLIGHILYFEGAHGADPVDGCAVDPTNVKGSVINPETNKPYDSKHPNNFIHTNKGVCFMTYKHYKRIKNQPVNVSEFLLMKQNLWEDIYRVLFWNVIQGDKLKSQGIAEFFLDSLWGSGASTTRGAGVLFKQVQTYLNDKYKADLQVTGKIDNTTVNALNRLINTNTKYLDLINYMYAKRLQFLQQRNTFWKYGKGWTRRLNTLTERIKKYSVGGAGLNLGLFILPLFLLFIVKK